MKTRFYFPMIISLLVISVSLLTACGDSDNPLSDTTKLFFFKQKTAYEISACLVGSEMCIRDRGMPHRQCGGAGYQSTHGGQSRQSKP